MSGSFFLDKKLRPSEPVLARVLGKSKPLWDEIKADVTARYAPLSEAWGYSGKSHGWSLALKQRKRSIVYLVPKEGAFTCSLAFSEKAAAEAQHRALPTSVKEMIEKARHYPEGRAVRMQVHSAADAAVAKELVCIKVECL